MTSPSIVGKACLGGSAPLQASRPSIGAQQRMRLGTLICSRRTYRRLVTKANGTDAHTSVVEPAVVDVVDNEVNGKGYGGMVLLFWVPLHVVRPPWETLSYVALLLTFLLSLQFTLRANVGHLRSK